MSDTGLTNVIIDPANPPLVFDGRLTVYSTCRACGELMKVLRPEDKSHPTCYRVDTELESLWDTYVMEDRNGDIEGAALTLGLIESVQKLELGRAASEYTTWGWPVFPLANRSKLPAISKDKGGKGFKDATTETYRIDRRWTRFPLNNIGLATGHAFDVIDIDTKDKDGNPDPKGINSFLGLMDAGAIADVHGVAVTASGGMHLFVKPTGKGCFAGIRPGIDYRGIGGYVVGAPSTLGKPGRSYSWLVEPSPELKHVHRK